MNHTEAIHEIIKVAPGSAEDLNEFYRSTNSFMVINVFTRQIQNLILRKDNKNLLNCLNKMNEIYRKGDQNLKNAVESIFIYSLDRITFNCETTYRHLIFEKMPLGLQKAYVRQIYHSAM